MKNWKYLVMAVGMMVLPSKSMNAQIVENNEQAIVYYMPFTRIAITAEYEVIEREAGRFAAYAGLLGIENPVLQSDTTYRMIRLWGGTKTEADPNRAYKVVATKDGNEQLLTLTKKGILYGYNIAWDEEKKQNDKKHSSHKSHSDLSENVMPLLEEGLESDSKEQQAQAAAKQIFHLREARTYLLTGESETPVADGKQMDLLLKEMHKQELALTELFTGKTTCRKEEKTIYYTPSQSTEVIIGRFSEEEGLTGADDEGTPIKLMLIAQHQKAVSPAVPAKKSKKDPQPSQIYYNLPGSVEMTLLYGDKLLEERKIDVAQFGVAVPLTKDLIVPGTHIRFNTLTGNIQSITK